MKPKRKGRFWSTYTEEEKCLNQVFLCARNGAKLRNYTFELSREEAFELFRQDCYYCGSPPYLREYSMSYVSPRGKRYTRRLKAFCNGIDRVDNTKGYTAANSVACCKQCNRGKNDLSQEEWLAWLDRLVQFRTQQTLT